MGHGCQVTPKAGGGLKVTELDSEFGLEARQRFPVPPPRRRLEEAAMLAERACPFQVSGLEDGRDDEEPDLGAAAQSRVGDVREQLAGASLFDPEQEEGRRVG